MILDPSYMVLAVLLVGPMLCLLLHPLAWWPVLR